MTSGETPELTSLSWAHRETLVPNSGRVRQVDVVSIANADRAKHFKETLKLGPANPFVPISMNMRNHPRITTIYV